jgi:hypothetical protein
MFIEKGYSHNCKTDPFEVSDADTMLAYLKNPKKETTAKKVAKKKK